MRARNRPASLANGDCCCDAACCCSADGAVGPPVGIVLPSALLDADRVGELALGLGALLCGVSIPSHMCSSCTICCSCNSAVVNASAGCVAAAAAAPPARGCADSGADKEPSSPTCASPGDCIAATPAAVASGPWLMAGRLAVLLPGVLPSCRTGSWKLLQALFWQLLMLMGAATVRHVSDASTWQHSKAQSGKQPAVSDNAQQGARHQQVAAAHHNH